MLVAPEPETTRIQVTLARELFSPWGLLLRALSMGPAVQERGASKVAQKRWTGEVARERGARKAAEERADAELTPRAQERAWEANVKTKTNKNTQTEVGVPVAQRPW